jgi:subtilisin family serine protease
MRKLYAFLLVAAVCGAAALPSAMVSAQRSPASFPMIVVFRDGAEFQATGADPDERFDGNPALAYLDRRAIGLVQAYERAHGFRAEHVYGAALKGFSAHLTARQIDALENDPSVDYVVADGTAYANAQTLPWGINKIDADTSSTLAGNGSGAVTNVNVYVIDSGVTTHQDINLVNHVNFAGGQNTDCNGHGTHVAGTVAARDNTLDVVGVAPGAPVTGVKVLGCSGSGAWSGVIAGIDWVTANARKPAVANMSLGGGANKAVDDAVVRSANSGVLYALAASNDGDNACNYSPARAGAGSNNGIVTVAATDSSDREASWSNYGQCVDIWAPGVSILSTKRGSGTTTMSGTSMASPHVAGGGALYLSSHTSASPSSVEQALKSAATTTANRSKDGRTITRLYVGGF